MILKFSEVLEIKNGKNQKKVENKNGKYPIYGSGGIIGWANEYLCEKENIIIGRKGSINKPIFVDTPFWNVDTAFGLIANREILDSKYLYYFCLSFDFEKLSTTVTIPSLTKNNLLNIKFNVPSLAKQRKIVKKLDKIQEIIKKYQQELIEFEKLSKSIFIEMFGDPIKNEKKWELKKMLVVAPIQQSIKISKEVVWLLNLDAIESETGKIIKYEKKLFKEIEKNSIISFNEENVLYSKLRPYLNKVVIPEEEGYGTSELLPLKPDKNKIKRMFLASLLRTKSFVNYVNNKTMGAKMPRVSTKEVMNFNCVIPPIELQNSFAERIKMIEKSKFLLLNFPKVQDLRIFKVEL